MSDDFPTWSKETPMNLPSSIIHNGVMYTKADSKTESKSRFSEKLEEIGKAAKELEDEIFGTGTGYSNLDDLYETSKQNYDAPYSTVNTVPNPDNVIHPSHYTQNSEIECIDAIRASMDPAAFAGYCKGNCLKYIWRYTGKNGIEDLEKAQVYLTWLINTLKGENLTK